MRDSNEQTRQPMSDVVNGCHTSVGSTPFNNSWQFLEHLSGKMAAPSVDHHDLLWPNAQGWVQAKQPCHEHSHGPNPGATHTPHHVVCRSPCHPSAQEAILACKFARHSWAAGSLLRPRRTTVKEPRRCGWAATSVGQTKYGRTEDIVMVKKTRSK